MSGQSSRPRRRYQARSNSTSSSRYSEDRGRTCGGERGLLILLRNDEPRIEAEATTVGRGLKSRGYSSVTPPCLPESVLYYVIRTRESVILDDAHGIDRVLDGWGMYSGGGAVRALPPLGKSSEACRRIYLENNLTPRAFTLGRIAVLELLASQAAISLENAGLYFDRKRAEEELRRSEAFLAEGRE